MKKQLIAFVLLLSIGTLCAQNKEKIKGSKEVKKETKSFEAIVNLEIEDDIEVTLIRGENCRVEIEADDNLHPYIKAENSDNKLRLYTTKKCTNYKKLNITVTYNSSLQSITARHKSKVSAISEIDIPQLTVNTYDSAESNFNIKSTDLNVYLSDKSDTDLTISATNVNIQAKNDASSKSIINCDKLTLSVVEKAKFDAEGNSPNTKLIISGKGKINGKKMICSDVSVINSEDGDCSIYCSSNFDLTATNNSKTELYGETQEIKITSFKNKSSLNKKESKK